MIITIRTEEKSDYAGIREVNKLAFDNRTAEANLVEAIRKTESFIPELSLVAVKEDKEMIGHILFSLITIETDGKDISTLALAPMAVKPEYQNLGVGSKLITEGLKVSRNLGYQHIIVLGHPKFYPRFGFASAKQIGIEAPYPVPEEAFMYLELEPGSLSGITGKVKYPPAFDIV
ncbi:GNAT family N-acetyltransferase [Scopulibacillus cellulosilyticus]|uniref:GNAT family N-acetyltransferase n=1 Tax=Scopulibacillus cellulosilyticus TaxID=2665665 RepID=A0ABW2Q2C5_9BACL